MDSKHVSTDSLRYYDSNDKLQSESKKQPNCLQKAGSFLAGGLELFYYRLGVEIAKRPVITIACVLVACIACTAGLVNFYEVDASDPIWVDPKSTYMTHKKWVEEKFPSQLRLSFFIAEGDNNILTPSAILELYEIHNQVTSISEDGYDYEKLCTRFGRGDDADCWSSSILELWKFDRNVIVNLTTADILNAVNATKKSPVTDAAFDINAYLGGLTVDASGRITEAKAAIFTYYMQGTNASNTEYVTEDKTTALTEMWELQFINITKEYSGKLITRLLGFSTRSFGDEIGSSIFGDVYMLSAGYVLIIVYVALILGRFNCVEMRIYLALGAVMAVGLSIAVSFGLSSAFGIGYGPVQSILPFLLLGLGVDDAFVIVQAWNRLSPAERLRPLTEQSGHALKHAGVSITVTSVTDIVAFGIGATTVLPALKDFCIYATLGILAVFIIQATFFMACVVLDEKRRKAYRNGCCCCYSHGEDYEPRACSQRDLQQKFFENYYSEILVKLPVKIVIIVISLALLTLGIVGVVFLKQEYDPNSFIPKNSYLKDYFNTYEKYFPDQGIDSGFIYVDQLSYYTEYQKITNMVDGVRQESSVNSDSIDLWLDGYVEWLNTTRCPWVKSHVNLTTRWPLDETRFNMLLTPYVYMTAAGRRHIRNVKFNETVTFGDDSSSSSFNLSNIIASGGSNANLSTSEILELEADFSARYLITTRVPFDFIDMGSSSEHVAAMDNTRAVVENYYTDTNAFPFSKSFETWETDKIIQQELYRNLGLAFGCVVILTLLLIADIGTCLLVSICVLSTLVEVGGFMYFWNLSVDTVTCIQLVLAIGLAVDYSAHIGHSFMTVVGERNARTKKMLADIGPAVFNGGFSTLLAFILLASSSSYVFDVFFKVNLLVVFLGLWNGMVLLPVLLSLVGPPPYLSAQATEALDSNLPNKVSVAGNGVIAAPDNFMMKGKNVDADNVDAAIVSNNGYDNKSSSKDNLANGVVQNGGTGIIANSSPPTREQSLPDAV